MPFVQVGVQALRTPTGEFLPSQPIYIEVPEQDINPKTGMTHQEEKTLTDIGKIFAEKFGQYANACKKTGL